MLAKNLFWAQNVPSHAQEWGMNITPPEWGCIAAGQWILRDNCAKSTLQTYIFTTTLIGITPSLVVCLICPYSTLSPLGALIKVQAQTKGHSFVISASRREQPSSVCQDNKIRPKKPKTLFLPTLSLWFMCFSCFFVSVLSLSLVLLNCQRHWIREKI